MGMVWHGSTLAWSLNSVLLLGGQRLCPGCCRRRLGKVARNDRASNFVPGVGLFGCRACQAYLRNRAGPCPGLSHQHSHRWGGRARKNCSALRLTHLPDFAHVEMSRAWFCTLLLTLVQHWRRSTCSPTTACRSLRSAPATTGSRPLPMSTEWASRLH